MSKAACIECSKEGGFQSDLAGDGPLPCARAWTASATRLNTPGATSPLACVPSSVARETSTGGRKERNTCALSGPGIWHRFGTRTPP